MIDYDASTLKVGSAVHNHVTGEAYDVEEIRWNPGHGWQVWTRTVSGYMGPMFYADDLPPFDSSIYAE